MQSAGGHMDSSDLEDAPTTRMPIQTHQRTERDPQRRSDSLWNPSDVASFLRVSRSWVYQKAEAGLLPVIRMPGSALLRFDPDLVRAFARGEWKPATARPVHAAKSRK